MTKYVVANAAEIEPGQRKIIELEGRSIGVFNVDGEYYALLNQCPHAGAALCEHGTIFGVSASEGPDQIIEYERGRSLRCPWHQWEFDIRTGQSWYDPRNTKVRKYEVEVVPGSPEDVVDPDGGVQKGPHVMEGYAVSIEGDVVVVDTSRRRAGTQRNKVAAAPCAETESAKPA
ncbi:Rieske (2Fe-2S) protein [Rhodococcus sp. NPDC057014]|uniref:Rieske (2Fe-2S) protein n=1 Tax=Rhodococcus sp. NPDC057014 TaxID=3346000 RepID=UPI0036406D53